MATLSVVQIVVQVDGQDDYCAVAMPQDRKDMLVGFIQALSDGPIKLVKLTGVKMIPITELEASNGE